MLHHACLMQYALRVKMIFLSSFVDLLLLHLQLAKRVTPAGEELSPGLTLVFRHLDLNFMLAVFGINRVAH